MSWLRGAAIAVGGLFLAGCGQAATPVAVLSPIASPTPTEQASPIPSPSPSPSSKASPKASPSVKPSPEPTPPPPVASVTCKGAPTSAMSVVAGVFLYDVSDPIHPRLVCRAENTFMQLIAGKAIVYTKPATSGKAAIVRRDLATGAESQVALLPADPRGSKTWTPDGSLEVYATQGKPINDYSGWVPIHLWSNGTDHVIYSIVAGVGGIESRWSVVPVVEFSPTRTYVAISDSMYSIRSSQVRIFTVANPHGYLVGNAAHGGTWVGDDRFAWATGDGVLMQWTPAGGVAPYRSEKWFGPTRSSDAQWLAGTLLLDYADPHVLIVPISGGAPTKTGLGSGPGFVSPTVVWYIGEKLCNSATDQCGADPTLPDGTVHAYNVTTKTDQIVSFRAGEQPSAGGYLFLCCTTRV